jgi:hypothetical protein
MVELERLSRSVEENAPTCGAWRTLGRSALHDGRFETAAELLSQTEAVSDDGPRWLLESTQFAERMDAALHRSSTGTSTGSVGRDHFASIDSLFARSPRLQA